MKATEFCYWLQGMFELTEVKSLDEQQTDMIRRHLAMAFQHDIDQRPSKEEQAKLNKIHTSGGIAQQTDPSKILMRC